MLAVDGAFRRWPDPGGGTGVGQREIRTWGLGWIWLLQELVRLGDCLVEGILGWNLVEQGRLDRREDDLVDVRLLLDRRDDVRVGRDDALGERPSAVFDGRGRCREVRVVIRDAGGRINGDLLGELDHAPRV